MIFVSICILVINIYVSSCLIHQFITHIYQYYIHVHITIPSYSISHFTIHIMLIYLHILSSTHIYIPYTYYAFHIHICLIMPHPLVHNTYRFPIIQAYICCPFIIGQYSKAPPIDTSIVPPIDTSIVPLIDTRRIANRYSTYR